MPRNDQITRQWNLLRRLENSHGLTLPELVDCELRIIPKDARTVRRQLEFFLGEIRSAGSVYRVVDRAGIKN